MTAADIIMKHAAAAIAGRWPEFAVAYGLAQAVFAEAEQSQDDDVTEAAHAAFAPLYFILLDYPARSHAELAEKAALLNIDCWDKAAAFDALSSDLSQLSVSPDRTAWTSAVETLETARTAFDAEVPAGLDANEIGQSRWDAYFTAWSHLIDLPAPDAEATAYKIRAYISLAHEEALGDSADNVETLQRLWGETAADSVFGILRLLRDACLQAGIDHPVTTMAADT